EHEVRLRRGQGHQGCVRAEALAGGHHGHVSHDHRTGHAHDRVREAAGREDHHQYGPGRLEEARGSPLIAAITYEASSIRYRTSWSGKPWKSSVLVVPSGRHPAIS